MGHTMSIPLWNFDFTSETLAWLHTHTISSETLQERHHAFHPHLHHLHHLSPLHLLCPPPSFSPSILLLFYHPSHPPSCCFPSSFLCTFCLSLVNNSSVSVCPLITTCSKIWSERETEGGEKGLICQLEEQDADRESEKKVNRRKKQKRVGQERRSEISMEERGTWIKGRQRRKDDCDEAVVLNLWYAGHCVCKGLKNN